MKNPEENKIRLSSKIRLTQYEEGSTKEVTALHLAAGFDSAKEAAVRYDDHHTPSCYRAQ